jgi:p-cumate 2,3-dioxygenase beta subunit
VATGKSVQFDAATQGRLEQLLYQEAELIDDWKLNEWLGLFADSASYVIPATNINADAAMALALVSDDRKRLEGRVRRLLSTHAHANNPRPRTRHVVSNVRAEEVAEGRWRVRANFIIYSMRNRRTNLYMGEYRYIVGSDGDGRLLIHEKRAVLDMETLEPAGGKINIVI